jgi:hypothetical protein
MNTLARKLSRYNVDVLTVQEGKWAEGRSKQSDD